MSMNNRELESKLCHKMSKVDGIDREWLPQQERRAGPYAIKDVLWSNIGRRITQATCQMTNRWGDYA